MEMESYGEMEYHIIQIEIKSAGHLRRIIMCPLKEAEDYLGKIIEYLL